MKINQLPFFIMKNTAKPEYLVKQRPKVSQIVRDLLLDQDSWEIRLFRKLFEHKDLNINISRIVKRQEALDIENAIKSSKFLSDLSKRRVVHINLNVKNAGNTVLKINTKDKVTDLRSFFLRNKKTRVFEIESHYPGVAAMKARNIIEGFDCELAKSSGYIL
jgi:predicted RNA-binding protein